MKEKIAIVIPSHKPYEHFLKPVLKNIRNSINQNLYPYKFIVSVTDNENQIQEAESEDTIVLKDSINNGENTAINQCFNYALRNQFDYLALTCDDHMIHESSSPIFDVIDYLKSPFFENRKYKMCAISTFYHPACYVDKYMTYPGGGRNPNNLIKNWIPNNIILRFLVISRNTLIDLYNGFFSHPAILSGHGDVICGYVSARNGEMPVEFNNVKFDFVPNMNDFDSSYKPSEKFRSLRFMSCDVAARLMNEYVSGTKIYGDLVNY